MSHLLVFLFSLILMSRSSPPSSSSSSFSSTSSSSSSSSSSSLFTYGDGGVVGRGRQELLNLPPKPRAYRSPLKGEPPPDVLFFDGSVHLMSVQDAAAAAAAVASPLTATSTTSADGGGGTAVIAAPSSPPPTSPRTIFFSRPQKPPRHGERRHSSSASDVTEGGTHRVSSEETLATSYDQKFDQIEILDPEVSPLQGTATNTSTTKPPHTPVYKLGAVFEPDHIQSLSSVFFQLLQEQNHLNGAVSRFEGVVVETPELKLGALKGACETLKSEGVSAGLAVGMTQSIYASGALASLAGVPLVVRSVKGYGDETLEALLPNLVMTNPRLSDLWKAATSFIEIMKWQQPVLIHDDSPQALQLAHIASRDSTHQPLRLSFSIGTPKQHFQNRLSKILHTVQRMVFVSGTTNFVSVLFSHSEDLGMFSGEYVWVLLDIALPKDVSASLRPGLISIRPDFQRVAKRRLFIDFVKSSLSVISEFFKEATVASASYLAASSTVQCEVPYRNLSNNQYELNRQLREKLESTRSTYPNATSLPGIIPFFYVENLMPKSSGLGTHWNRIGYINGSAVQINTIYWPGRGHKGIKEHRKKLRVALAEAPPFVMTSPLIENTTCLLGVMCLKVLSSEVAATFADVERKVVNASRNYQMLCCTGFAVDLMLNVAQDLEIQLQVYLVRDGTFGAPRSSGWTGVVGDLMDGSAHLSFAPLSVTAQRARILEFSEPYFYSSIAILSSTKHMSVPLLAFLVPFSAELWIAIIVSLNITAFSVAVYEWLSPFGLNPWGRQRSKNFSYGSALWVIWGLLFSHLVAFKAPKSWPNKVLINVWGAFSVIFVASYTANIAALFAGLFQTRYLHDRSLLSLRVGAVRASSVEYYVSRKDPELWAHMKPNLVDNFTHGLHKLHSGSLDLLVGDSAILDYLRANDPGCTLRAHGDDLVPDTFALAMPKGFPLRVKINALLARYQSSGHLDHLKHKWYGELPCFRLSADIYKPQALDISTVAGVFLALTLGIGVGLIILILEHLVYRYVLPSLRTKPKESVWRNRNLMFLSQKLYRFINCVELVSPHHSAKELVNNLRTGQIMGLFQKSVKRKENEQRRRRKSKAQFFEMIQEIRRVQKAEKEEEIPEAEVPLTESKPPSHAESEVPPVDPSPTPASSSVTPSHKPLLGHRQKTTNAQATIAIDYIPGPNPQEDSDGIIRVNSSQPLGNISYDNATYYSQRGSADREEDSESGILILRVKEEGVHERNCLNQKVESLQPYSPTSESLDNCDHCSYPSQDDGTSIHSKTSGGCLNCLQRQDSNRQERRDNGSTYYPCNVSYGTRETLIREHRITTHDGTFKPQRQNPPPVCQPIPTCRSSGSLKSFPGYTSRTKQGNVAVWNSKSLDQMDSHEEGLIEEVYEGVRLVPLSQQSALQSSGSLQLVAALSPGCERVNADHLRHVTKADLWRLWQDSEIQLRARLRQAESQRDELLRRLCQLTSCDSLGKVPDNPVMPEEPKVVKEKAVPGKFGSLDALLEVGDMTFQKRQ
ncbi:glutamate receptor ionotropic, NMDA 3A-like [Macrobrachium nipponense]|uniref:glutamate receptor ionotropic, NMDA 3A-like n=1 Tax=Macrobrachium nipponense TaxID=159736 RepID=UPI0030C81E56